MKKISSGAVVLLLIALLVTSAFGADKIVGEIKEVLTKDGQVIAIKVADEKQGGKVVEIKCVKECKAAKGTSLKAGEKVTIEIKTDSVSVRKAVAGC